MLNKANSKNGRMKNDLDTLLHIYRWSLLVLNQIVRNGLIKMNQTSCYIMRNHIVVS
jgi:hypothetical protein